MRTTINVGSKAPDVNGNVNAISASLTVNGEDGSDTVNVDDTSDTKWQYGQPDGNRFDRPGMSAGITYGTVEDLNISLGMPAATPLQSLRPTPTTQCSIPLGRGDTVHLQAVAGVTVVNTGCWCRHKRMCKRLTPRRPSTQVMVLTRSTLAVKHRMSNGNVNATSASLTVKRRSRQRHGERG